MGKIAIIGAGGTVSVAGRSEFDLVDYAESGEFLAIDQLISAYPEVIPDGVVAVPIPFRTGRSSAITTRDWLQLNELLHRLADTEDDLDGFVVAHGTSTMEETAYFLNLTVKFRKPVALVGSQRPLTALSSDAQINLRNSIRVVADPRSAEFGVVVVMNDEIHGARDVVKTSNYRLDAFKSHDFGALGNVDPDGSVTAYRHTQRRHTWATPFDVRGMSDLPRVDIVCSYVGADGAQVRAVVEAGALGIVSAGAPPGTQTPDEWTALHHARQTGVLVVQSSRGSGRVIRSKQLMKAGVIVADNLAPTKARVLASLALAFSRDAPQIQHWFDRY